MHVHRLEKQVLHVFGFCTQMLLAVCAMQGLVERGAPGQPEGVVMREAVGRSFADNLAAAAAEVAGVERTVGEQHGGSSVEIEERAWHDRDFSSSVEIEELGRWQHSDSDGR